MYLITINISYDGVSRCLFLSLDMKTAIKKYRFRRVNEVHTWLTCGKIIYSKSLTAWALPCLSNEFQDRFNLGNGRRIISLNCSNKDYYRWISWLWIFYLIEVFDSANRSEIYEIKVHSKAQKNFGIRIVNIEVILIEWNYRYVILVKTLQSERHSVYWKIFNLPRSRNRKNRISNLVTT